MQRPGADPADADDRATIDGLRRRDEATFVRLVERHQGALLRLALTHVADPAAAAEVVQETWLAVLRGIDRFEGRSALSTWVFAILLNQAKRRGGRERRSLPFSALGGGADDADAPAVDPDRFLPPGDRWAGHWAAPPAAWERSPEAGVLAGEIRAAIDRAIAALPPLQRRVILLRDVEGWPAAEACHVLGISETNQRVLLHRARGKVRRAIEAYMDGGGEPG